MEFLIISFAELKTFVYALILSIAAQFQEETHPNPNGGAGLEFVQNHLPRSNVQTIIQWVIGKTCRI
jgi:hypothetical protein